jgi:hypothetical protein
MAARTDQRRAVEPVKEGWCIAARMGSPAEPHTLAVLGARWEAQGRSMDLTLATIGRVETLPGGDAGSIVDRLAAARTAALDAKPRGGFHVYLDVTRSPEVRHLAMDAIPECVPVMVPTGPRMDWSVPFFIVGRITLLSHMSVLLAQKRLRAGALEAGGDERRMDRDRVREVLAKAQARPQKLDDEELALGGSVDDDAALCVALAAFVAAYNAPDPWVVEPRR